MNSLKEKSNEKKIYDLKKISIPHFYVNNNLIAKIIDNDNSIIVNESYLSKIRNRYILFFYTHEDTINLNEYYYKNFTNNAETEANKARMYINDIKEDLALNLGFLKKQRSLQMSIDFVERPENDNIKNSLPSFQRLNRMKKFHNNILNMILEILHNFYYYDFMNYIKNSKPIKYYLNMIIPIIMELVDSYEEEIYKEYL